MSVGPTPGIPDPPAPPPPSPGSGPGLVSPGQAQVVATLVGGVALLLSGVALLFRGEHTVGAVLVVAGAGELGVKVTTLL